MRHCPECRRPCRQSATVCPDCWTLLVDGPPPAAGALALVYEAHSVYEADMIEDLLSNEGIPCIRKPELGALPAAVLGPMAATLVRLYVHHEVAVLAAELIAEVTGGSAT